MQYLGDRPARLNWPESGIIGKPMVRAYLATGKFVGEYLKWLQNSIALTAQDYLIIKAWEAGKYFCFPEL